MLFFLVEYKERKLSKDSPNTE